MSGANDAPLPPSVLRSLSDRAYEKRKAAALEIESRVKDLMDSPVGGRQEIERILTFLGREYALSSQSNYRKGGLIGLAAATLGLGSDAHRWLDQLLPPVLSCFTDQDSRVRYYACEALYNISKVTRNHILDNFNQVFEGLCRLCSDIDQGVKNGAQLLDRLMKDIVSESQQFPLEPFVPVLREHLRRTNSHVRHFLIGWITTLHSVSHINLTLYLPEILEGLFSILGDPNREIRQEADSAVAHLLRSIQEAESPNDQEQASETRTPDTPQNSSSGAGTQGNIQFRRIIPILLRCAAHPTVSGEVKTEELQDTWGLSVDELSGGSDIDRTQASRVALLWLVELIRMGSEQVLLFTAEIVNLIFKSTAHPKEEIRKAAEEVDIEIRKVVSNSMNSAKSNEPELGFDLVAVLSAILGALKDQDVQVRLKGLSWMELLVNVLLDSSKRHMLDKSIPSLVHTLQHPEELVIRRALRVVALVSQKSKGEALPSIVRHIFGLFSSDRDLLQNRSGVIINELCLIHDPQAVYLEIGKTLESMTDEEVAERLTEKLTLILLTVPELGGLRAKLQLNSEKPNPLNLQLIRNPEGKLPEQNVALAQDDREFFLALYKSWSRFPASALALCLLAGEYRRSNQLVVAIAQNMRDMPADTTMRILIELDKLVQLLESPVFASLRMQLLEPHKEPELVKALYGLLMLLPQSEAFEMLRRRLKSVPTLALLTLNATSNRTS